MIILAWVLIVACVVLFIFSFLDMDFIIGAVTCGCLSFGCFHIAYLAKVDEYVYNCINKEAKQICVYNYNKTARLSVDEKVFIIKKENIEKLQCGGIVK